MIEGIGIDVVDIARFQESLDRTPAMRERIFTENEALLKVSSLAARFAAKEALVKALDARDEKILGEIRAAEAAQAKAKAAQSEFEKRLEEARTAADDMIRKARSEADRQADELRTRSQRELEDMRLRATQELESAKRTALAEIHAVAATLATTVAGKILKREIQPGDQKRLVDESLSEMTSR